MQLHCELLAGNEQPDLPDYIVKTLAILDTGCATSMANHRGQCEKGSIYASESKVSGASGASKTSEKGKLR